MTAVALDHPGLVRYVVNVDSVMVPEDPEPMNRAPAFIAYIATALHVVEHAGHFPFVEHPDAFDRVLTAFCGR